MKYIVGTIFGLALLIIAFFISLWWWNQQLLPASYNIALSQTLVIPPGQSAGVTVNQLFSAGLIRSVLAAKIYLRTSGLDQRLIPGSYDLNKGWSLPEIMARLSKGPQDIWVTIPEGFRREQIALRLESALPGFDIYDFNKASTGLEGQLFPDTYLIPAQASPSAIVAIFLTNFSKKSGLSLPADHDTLILASLVEREAKSDPDRALIAGILKKRLDAGMPLQVDASVQYAEDSNIFSGESDYKFWQSVSDTKIPSLFNTYLHPGLPPTPISNPGLASIQAAKQPQSSAYWYYLTGTDGVTRYAKTLPQHNLNIDKYLRP